MTGGFKNGKNRLEAFSDGVLAIIITIMILELKQPTGCGSQRFSCAYADFACVSAQLYVCSNLLGKPSSDVSASRKDQCQDFMVQYCMTLCDVIHTIRYGMGRHISDFLGSAVDLFSRYVACLHYISSVDLVDCP